MAHFHKMPNGLETSIEQVDGKNSLVHRHTFDGKQTSAEPFALGHTHTIEGFETSEPIEKDEKGLTMDVKYFGGRVTEVKQEDRNGVPVGLISGHIATFDVDRGLDRFLKGAFLQSIEEHMQKRRQIRFKDHHGRTVGGFPIESVREDEKGLFGVAEVNLEVQQGREAYSLAKQGVLSDFSIGFTSLDDEMVDGIRNIKKAMIWEGSIVDEPMNTAANVLEVKAAVPYQDLPLASRDRAWDSSAAIGRVREFTDSTDAPTSRYRNAFVWFDRENVDSFGAYKLPIADVVDGRLVVVPRAIFAAAAALQGARGGVDIPEADRRAVVNHIERYYAKMDLDSPFTEKGFYTAQDVKEMSERDIERALRDSGYFSKGASANLVSRMGAKGKLYTLDEAEVLLNLRSIRKHL